MARPICYVLIKADSAEDACSDAEYALEPYRGAVFNHLSKVDSKLDQSSKVINAQLITPENFLKYIEDFQQSNRQQIEEYLDGVISSSIDSIIFNDDVDRWKIAQAFLLADGHFTFDCPFFNALEDKTNLSEYLVSEIVKESEEFWLVPFELRC